MLVRKLTRQLYFGNCTVEGFQMVCQQCFILISLCNPALLFLKNHNGESKITLFDYT